MKKLAFFIISILLPMYTNAQSENNSGSFYSSFGLGSLETSNRTPFGNGLGLNGVALDRMNSVNFSNPALLSRYAFTTGTGALKQSIYTGNSNGASSTYSNFTFEGTSVIFPIDKKKLSIGLGMNPFSTVNYLGNIESTLPSDTTQINSQLRGLGGLNSLEASIGYKITKELSVGYSIGYLFGSILNSSVTSYNDPSFSVTYNGINDFYSGWTNQIGLTYELSNLFRDEDYLMLGLSYRIPISINATRYQENIILSDGFERPISEELFRRKITLPHELKFGLSYYPIKTWLIASDILIETWSGFNTITSNVNTTYNNRLRIGIGSAYIPELRTATKFLNSISYKLGFSYDTGYFKVANNSVSNWSVHTGISVPSPFSGSSFDLNFEYGQIGNLSNTNVSEDIFTLRLIVNLKEFMFFKRQLQ